MFTIRSIYLIPVLLFLASLLFPLCHSNPNSILGVLCHLTVAVLFFNYLQSSECFSPSKFPTQLCEKNTFQYSLPILNNTTGSPSHSNTLRSYRPPNLHPKEAISELQILCAQGQLPKSCTIVSLLDL